ALADAADPAGPRWPDGQVVDQLRDQAGLADARAAEQPGLAAELERGQQVYRLDAGEQSRGGRRPALQRERGPVSGAARGGLERLAAVHGAAEHVDHPTQQLPADGHLERAPGGEEAPAARDAVGAAERDAADRLVV